MTDAHPTAASSPYAPTTDARDQSRQQLRNPVGIAALIGAGLLVAAQAAFQFTLMSTVIAGEALSTNVVIQFVQPVVMGVLAVATVVLGVIAVLLRGRPKLAAGIGLGAGLYALASMIIGFSVGVGYSLA